MVRHGDVAATGFQRRGQGKVRARPDAAEVAPAPRPGDAAPDTIYVTGSDGGFEAILIACDNPVLLRSVTAPFDARLRGADRG